jgi:lipid-A-disaccharide synthase
MIVAGEASGDLHGAHLVRAAQGLAPDLEFYGMGGPRLQAAGADLLFDLEHMSMMGVVEIFSRLGHALRTLSTLSERLRRDRPAGLVLIDYPDFNFRLARVAKAAGIPVFYYICPQIWAWRKGRIRLMAKYVDRRVVAFPFEVGYYQQHGLTADFVGHPLLDMMAPPRPRPQVKAELGFDPDQRLLLLMPGSRRPLVRQLLPLMLDAAARVREKHPDLAVAVARADTLSDEFLASFLADGPADIRVVAGQSHLLQNAADLVLVASGTSTLETALMQTPMVVVYRLHWFSYLLGRLLIETDHIAAANLVAAERVAPELVQDECRPDRMAEELLKILDDPRALMVMNMGLARIRRRLGEPGAAQRAARLLLETIGREIPAD